MIRQPTRDEYISRQAFALDSPVDREPYTRLITCSRIEDLRADNQTFDDLELDEPRPGPKLTDAAGAETGRNRPWVYMEPDIYYYGD